MAWWMKEIIYRRINVLDGIALGTAVGRKDVDVLVEGWKLIVGNIDGIIFGIGLGAGLGEVDGWKLGEGDSWYDKDGMEEGARLNTLQMRWVQWGWMFITRHYRGNSTWY